eukprot:TRINITY_DN65259_c0_g1_i5.p1 TRINITY_DN65259_c0_g1~~TRINITY_DN65259_c0_g1_i5.p1  ORF type:complete len:160 (-),score=47.98 TRINITY_DN65259_c0_g1_i5:54-497(-)
MSDKEVKEDIHSEEEEEEEEYDSEDEEEEEEEEEEVNKAVSLVGKLSLSSAKNNENESYFEEEDKLHSVYDICFKLPNGNEKVFQCKTGETLINIKKKIHDEEGVSFDVTCYYNNSPLMDPMSLNDFPEIIEECKKEQVPVIELRAN